MHLALARIKLDLGSVDEARSLVETSLSQLDRRRGPDLPQRWLLIADHYQAQAEIYELLGDSDAAATARESEARSRDKAYRPANVRRGPKARPGRPR